jgi:hypothetical protein
VQIDFLITLYYLCRSVNNFHKALDLYWRSYAFVYRSERRISWLTLSTGTSHAVRTTLLVNKFPFAWFWGSTAKYLRTALFRATSSGNSLQTFRGKIWFQPSRVKNSRSRETSKRNYSRVSFCDGSFSTIHFYDPCRVGPSTPDLWCITVEAQASFLYLIALLALFRCIMSSFLFYFSAVILIWLWFFHPWRPSKRQVVLFCKKEWKHQERL